MKENKALRLTFYLSLGILVMLFFVFLTTFDFRSKTSTSDFYSDEEVTNELGNMLNKSMEEQSSLNTISIDFDSKLTSSLLYSTIKKEQISDIYSDMYWTLNGLSVGFENGKIILHIHAKYHKSLNYNLHIRVYLNFEENDDSYVLSVSRIRVGIYLIPRSVIQNVLHDKTEGSIGLFINNVISTIPLGTLSQSDLSYEIKKMDISEKVENGTILSNLFQKDSKILPIASFYFGTIFENNLASIEISNSIVLKLDYSKIINGTESITYKDEEEKILNMSNEELISYHNEMTLAYLLNENEIDIDGDMLNCLLDQKTIELRNSENKYINLKKTHISIVNDEIRLSLVFSIFNQNSKLDLIFEKRGSRYYIKTIEVGRDKDESYYITVSNTKLITSVLEYLYSSNIGNGSYTSSIQLIDLIFDPMLEKDEVITIENDNVKMTLEEDTYNAIIEQCLKSETFEETIKDELPSFDSSTNESIIASYHALSSQDKNIYFNKIKNFFKSESSVYNYIIKIANEE